MKKKRKKRAASTGRTLEQPTENKFNAPFIKLGTMLKQMHAETQSGDDVGLERSGEKDDHSSLDGDSPEFRTQGEERLFKEAMAGVKPLSCSRVSARVPGPLVKPSRRPLIESELEAYAELVDLVSGDGRFDIQHTDEYVEGMVVGADPGILQKLRQGDFSIQAHLDLHGMVAEEARQALERFIVASVAERLRCVLIIHGRGLNSRERIPILKQHMASWLKRGRLKRLVLAFTTARPCDGGAGALYVLLRKSLPESI
jgi:DNA-nicking Smr family endonuclease